MRFTKIAIMQSFERFLSEKPFEKITVKDIVEDCGINRKTFYYYFEDIYDLLEKTFRKSFESILDSFESDMSLEDRARSFFEFAQNNKTTIRHVYNSSDKKTVEKYICNIFYEGISGRIKADCSKLGLCDSDVELISLSIVNILAGTIFKWIDDGMKNNAADIAARLTVILDGIPELMVENALKKQK